MMKFLKRLFVLSCLVTLAAGAWGYAHGLRRENYKAFIGDLIAKYTAKADTSTIEPKERTYRLKKKMQPNTKNTVAAQMELQPLPSNPYAKIDSHARNCPPAAEEDIETLAGYLQEGASSDLEKARAIYVWLTKNIRYDDAGYNSGHYGDNSAEAVLYSRKAVCAGFSSLYFALGEAAGLDIKKVAGYAKGYSYTPGMRFKDTNHAWNIIRINGNYRVFDATWGQGGGKTIEGKLVSGNEFDPFWFNVDPYAAICSHLPENNEPAYIHPALDLKTFEVLPNPDDAYFELGFNSQETYTKALADHAASFPACYKVATFIKMRTAPSQGVLHTNQKYTFEFYIPRGSSVALVDARNNWTYLQGQKGVFSLTYTPAQTGELLVCLQYDRSGASFQTFLEYTVQEGKSVL